MSEMHAHHEHDHGPDCQCGCHDHEHEHAHEHEHEHGLTESLELTLASCDIEAHSHEQASTVSVALQVKEGQELAFGKLVDVMVAVAERVESAGGIVGHIKASCNTGDDFARASVTAAGLAPQVEGAGVVATHGSDVKLVFIAMLVGLEDLLEIAKAHLSELE